MYSTEPRDHVVALLEPITWSLHSSRSRGHFTRGRIGMAPPGRRHRRRGDAVVGAIAVGMATAPSRRWIRVLGATGEIAPSTAPSPSGGHRRRRYRGRDGDGAIPTGDGSTWSDRRDRAVDGAIAVGGAPSTAPSPPGWRGGQPDGG